MTEYEGKGALSQECPGWKSKEMTILEINLTKYENLNAL